MRNVEFLGAQRSWQAFWQHFWQPLTAIISSMTPMMSPADAGSPAPQVRLVSIETATQLLGIGRTTVYDLINRGELRSTKIGRRTLLAVEDIDAFVRRKLASA